VVKKAGYSTAAMKFEVSHRRSANGVVTSLACSHSRIVKSLDCKSKGRGIADTMSQQQVLDIRVVTIAEVWRKQDVGLVTCLFSANTTESLIVSS
jgi:hypothetical protein